MARTTPLVLGLLLHGYEYASRTAERLGTQVFRTRILFKRAVVATGTEAVEEFYVPGRLTRLDAQLLPAQILQDHGTVQTLDGPDHRDRKAMLLSVLCPTAVDRLVALIEERWREWLRDPPADVDLLSVVRRLLCEAACDWVGIAPGTPGIEQRSADLALLIEASGSFSPRLVRGQLARDRCLRWAADAVRDARRQPPSRVPSPLTTIAAYPSPGNELPVRVAAGEVLNLLRPLVAVAHFVVFATIALHEHPAAAEALGDEPARERFVHEVRRYYPFFPLVAGRALRRFTWQGEQIKPGTRCFLDLYAINHDEAVWTRPSEFDPDRFKCPSALQRAVPQGGGDVRTGHRCAGEQATLRLVTTAVRMLRDEMSYDVAPDRHLEPGLRRIPALPKPRVRLLNVRRTGSASRSARPPGRTATYREGLQHNAGTR